MAEAKKSNLTINQVIIQVRENVRNPTKNNRNPLFKNEYADLTEVLSVLMEAFPDGSTFTQAERLDENGNPVIVLSIWTNDNVEDVSTIPIFQMDAHKGTNKLQMIGQSITYLRRYQLKSFFGLGDVDDDGNSQGQSNNQGSNSNRSNGNSFNKRKANKSKIEQIDDMIRVIADTTNTEFKHVFAKTLKANNLEKFEGINNEKADRVIQWLGSALEIAKQRELDNQAKEDGEHQAKKEEAVS